MFVNRSRRRATVITGDRRERAARRVGLVVAGVAAADPAASGEPVGDRVVPSGAFATRVLIGTPDRPVPRPLRGDRRPDGPLSGRPKRPGSVRGAGPIRWLRRIRRPADPPGRCPRSGPARGGRSSGRTFIRHRAPPTIPAGSPRRERRFRAGPGRGLSSRGPVPVPGFGPRAPGEYFVDLAGDSPTLGCCSGRPGGASPAGLRPAGWTSGGPAEGGTAVRAARPFRWRASAPPAGLGRQTVGVGAARLSGSTAGSRRRRSGRSGPARPGGDRGPDGTRGFLGTARPGPATCCVPPARAGSSNDRRPAGHQGGERRPGSHRGAARSTWPRWWPPSAPTVSVRSR